MNPRAALARLNPPIARYGVPGANGPPILSPQDIAAALGMVREKLGREVMCHLYWPAGAQITLGSLHDAIRVATSREIRARRDALAIAQADLVTLLDRLHDKRTQTPEDERMRGILKARVAVQRSHQFPLEPQHYHVLREAVLSELRATNHCRACQGRGHSAHGEADQRICPDCGGKGRIPVSDRDRAKWIGRDESRYRRTWRPMYEWLFNHLSQCESTAARELWEALRDPPTWEDL